MRARALIHSELGAPGLALRDLEAGLAAAEHSPLDANLCSSMHLAVARLVVPHADKVRRHLQATLACATAPELVLDQIARDTRLAPWLDDVRK